MAERYPAFVFEGTCSLRGTLAASADPVHHGGTAPMRKALLALAALVAAVPALLVATTATGAPSAPVAIPGCDKGTLHLVSSGTLTVGTDNPAYPPWFGGTPK